MSAAPQDTSKGLLAVSYEGAGAGIRRLFRTVDGASRTLGCAVLFVRNPQDRTWWDVVTVGAIWICAAIALYVSQQVQLEPADLARWLLEVFAALFVISGVARIAQGSILRPDDAEFLEDPEIRRSHQSRAEIDHLLVRRVAALAIDASRLCREGAAIAVIGLLLHLLNLSIEHAAAPDLARMEGGRGSATANGVVTLNGVATFKMEQSLAPETPPPADAPVSPSRLDAPTSAENYQNAKDLPL